MYPIVLNSILFVECKKQIYFVVLENLSIFISVSQIFKSVAQQLSFYASVFQVDNLQFYVKIYLDVLYFWESCALLTKCN